MSTDETNPLGSNPYQPSGNASLAGMDQEIQLPQNQTRGMVGQVTVLGVLMILQGIIDCLAGVVAAFYAWFMPQMFQEMRAQMAKQAAAGGGAGGAPAPAPPPLPDNFELYFAIGGGVAAAALLFIGLLLIFGGIGVMRFERRGLAIASLCVGMLTIMTCYCFPTSLALAVYGMIVLMNQPVALAFTLRSQGYPVRRIQQAFMALY